MSKPLTVDGFIQTFRDKHGWECKPGTRITDDLTVFASEREGSTRDVDELYVLFCVSHGLIPYNNPKNAT